MTQYAGIRGIAGTVIDGVCRDVNRAIDDGYPILPRGAGCELGKIEFKSAVSVKLLVLAKCMFSLATSLLPMQMAW